MSETKFSKVRLAVQKWVFCINEKLLTMAQLPYQWLAISQLLEALIQITSIAALTNRSLFLSIGFNTELPQIIGLFLFIYIFITSISCALCKSYRILMYFLHLCIIVAPILLLPTIAILYFSITSCQYYLVFLLGVTLIVLLLVLTLYHKIHLEFTFSRTNTITKTSKTNILLNRLMTAGLFLFGCFLSSNIITIIVMSLLFLNILDECYKSMCCNLFLVPILSKVSSILAILKLNICLIAIFNVSSIRIDILNQNEWWLIVTSMVFQIIGFLNFYRYRVMSVSLMDMRGIEDQDNAELYAREFVRLSHQKGQGNLYYKGIRRDHKRVCKDVDCQCRAIQKPNKSQKASIFLLRIIKILRQSLSESRVLQFLEVYCIVELTGFYPLASHLIYQLSTPSWSNNLTDRWLLFDLRFRLAELVRKRFQGHNLELNRIFVYKKLSNELKEQIKLFTQSAVEKLRLLCDPVVDLVMIEQVCQKQLPILPLINDLYKQILEMSRQTSQISSLMVSFKTNVLLDVQQANAFVMNSYLQQKSKNTIAQLEQDMDACVIQLSQTHDSLSTITNCTDNFQSTFGYMKEEAVGSKFQMLLPQAFRRQFGDQIEKWFKTGNWQLLHKPIEGFALGKGNLMFGVKMFAKLLVNFQQMRIAIWMKKNGKTNFGILDRDGKVSCLGPKLKILCNRQSIYFQIICPKMSNVMLSLTQQWVFHEMHVFVPATGHVSILGRLQKTQTNLGGSSLQQSKIIQKHVQRFSSAYLCWFNIKLIVQKNGDSCIIMELINIKHSNLKQLIKETPASSTLREICEQHLQKSSIKNIQNLNGQTTEQFDQSRYSHTINQQKQSSTAYMNDLPEDLVQDNLSSVRSSTILDYSFRSLVKEIKAKYMNPNPSRAVKIITGLMISCSLLMIILLLVEYLIGKDGMKSFMNIIFADAAVSDNMQLLEMFYGKAIQFYQYFSDRYGARFAYILKNAKSLSDYLYSLVYNDHLRLNQDITFGNRRFYQYLLYPLPLTVGSSTQSIISSQFIFQYYNAITQLIDDMTLRIATKDAIYSKSVLEANWNSMKFMNHNNLYQYEMMSWDLMDRVTTQLIIIMVVYALLSGFQVIELFLLNRKAKNDIAESMKLYEHITNQDLEGWMFKLEKHMEYQAGGKTRRVFLDTSSYQICQKRTFNKKKDGLGIVKYILMFAIFNSSALINSGTILTFWGPCKQMIHSINSLMDSENYQLEALFDLKTYYLDRSYPRNFTAFTQDFMKQYQHSELDFVNTAVTSLQIFGLYDKDYRKEFTQMLTIDVCEVVKNVGLADWEMEKCHNGFNTGLLKQGILGAMNQMHRKTIEAALTLVKNPDSAYAYFNTPVYEDIDDSIIYMFKVYQLTQARMVVALSKAIQQRDNMMVSVTTLQILFITACGIFWLKYYQYQRQVQRCRFGYIVLISPDIISANKHIRNYVTKEFRMNSQ